MAKTSINQSKITKKDIQSTKARLNTKRTIKTVKAKSNVKDKSLSPVVMKVKKRVSDQTKNKALKDANISALKSPAKRGRPPKSPVHSSEAIAQKSDDENNTKSVERVIDIREIKQHAQKILKEKQENKLPKESVPGPRISLRGKPLTPPSTSPPETTAPRGRGRPKVIQTISDGPTVNLLTQNKIIQKTLPKDLRNVQKKLLKKQIENKKKSGKPQKKVAGIAKKAEGIESKNQKIIEKLSKVLLKRKVMTKSQLITLVKNQSDFKTIAMFASLLKQSKKIVKDGPKNEWNVSSKDDEEEEEEEEDDEDSFEMVDDEDQDKDYVPPAMEERAYQKSSSGIVNNFNTSTPLQAAFSKSYLKSTTASYKRKKNRLSEGSQPLYPLDSIKRLGQSDGQMYPLEGTRIRKSTPRTNATISPSTGDIESSEPEESVSSIRALIEQTTSTASSSTPQRGNKIEHTTPSTPAQNTPAASEVAQGAYYCDVCNKVFRSKHNLKNHRETWRHKLVESASLNRSKEQSTQATREKKLKLMSQIKKEMISNMAAQIRINDSIKGESPMRIFNRDGCDKFILDSELNLSLVVDSLNLILTNDVEDDEDAYDTLQMALGASDADMDILKHLAGQTIIADYMYDNHDPESNEGIFDPSESALLIEDFRHDQIDIDLETRAMGCPSTECNRTFFGLIGLQTHVKYYHRNEVFLQRKTSYRHLLGPDPLKYVCFVCKEMFSVAAARDSHVQDRHVVNYEKNIEDKARLVDTFREIFEFTLRRCVANAEKSACKSSDGDGDGMKGDEKLENDLEGGKEVGQETSSQVLEDDTYDEVTLLGAKFVRKLCALEDGQRAYDLLAKLVAPTEENEEFVNNLIVKLHTILGKVVRSSLLPISNQMVISSRQQHNIFNSDSRERRFVCPLCGLRFLVPWMRNKHLTRAHPELAVKISQLSDEAVLDLTRLGLHEPVGSRSVTPDPGGKVRRPRWDKDRLELAQLNKVEVLNELKIRMNKKMMDRAREAREEAGEAMMSDEEEMLALEEEYLQENEELRALEVEYIDIMKQTSSAHRAETASKTRPPKNLQDVIQEIQTSLKPPGSTPTPPGSTPTPPGSTPAPASPRQHKPPYVKVNNNFKCAQCDRLFIREDELFHHTRLEHADKSLAAKLEDLRRRKVAASGVGGGIGEPAPLSGMSPIKPVEIISPGEEAGTPAAAMEKKLAPLLTRREQQQTTTPIPGPRAAKEDALTGNALKVGATTKEVVLDRTTSDTDRRRIILSDGRIDQVILDDRASLIQFKGGVKVTSLREELGPRPPIHPPPPPAPIIKTPFASKLVSKLRSELCRKSGGAPSSLAVVRSSRETPPVPAPAGPSSGAPQSTPAPGPSSTPDASQSSNVLKRGPRTEAIPDQERLTALAQLRALTASDNRRKKRSAPPGQRAEVLEVEEEDSEEEEEFEEDGDVLLTNRASWRRVAEVERDWETSDEEEEEEEVRLRVTRGKRRS